MDESVLLLIQGILNNPKAITEYKLRINPQKRSQALFHFVAKPGGLWTTILGMFSIQVSTTITITPQEPHCHFPSPIRYYPRPYEEMIAELNARGHPAYAVDLKRFDWLKITKCRHRRYVFV